MLEVKIARIYRETLTVTEEQEVGASDITEQIRQIVKRSRISDGFVQVFPSARPARSYRSSSKKA
jgi:thiamine phosphate synthase YjbQ (UPF0047 family)